MASLALVQCLSYNALQSSVLELAPATRVSVALNMGLDRIEQRRRTFVRHAAESGACV